MFSFFYKSMPQKQNFLCISFQLEFSIIPKILSQQKHKDMKFHNVFLNTMFENNHYVVIDFNHFFNLFFVSAKAMIILS